jgi:hypothetical protein
MKIFTKRRIVISSAVVVGFIVLAEIMLRLLWGFGSMVLFMEDSHFEYLARPNQEHTRFGNRIYYNEHSMRSNPITPADSCVVLGFGDSVLNGGTLTDQDSLATTIVENQLGGNIRFLNISAGSWGPDNCAAYLEQHGDFNAKMIVLFVSSHDAHDNITFEKVVDIDPSYPGHQYPLAIIEVVDKYLIPRIAGLMTGAPAGDNLMINKNGEGFNTGFQFFVDRTQKAGIPFLVCLHAERAEVENGAFNSQGAEILEFCTRNNVKVITGLEIGEKADFYRDEIHLNEKGQRAWVNTLSREIKANLSSCVN